MRENMREKYGLGLITPGICLHYINTYQELTGQDIAGPKR